MKNLLKILLSIVTLIAMALALNFTVKEIRNNNMNAKLDNDLIVAQKYFALENYEKAAEVYETVLEQTSDIEAFYKLAQSYYNLEMYNQALSSVNRLILVEGTNEINLVIKADSLSKIGLVNESLELLDSIDINELSSYGYAVYANNFLEIDQYDIALDYARKALSIDQENEHAIIALASVYYSNNDYSRAQEVLNDGYRLTKSAMILDEIETSALVFKDN
jgi:tetratricopeptide (TPR) repeat protein